MCPYYEVPDTSVAADAYNRKTWKVQGKEIPSLGYS